jgi:hypothetical protein
MRIEVFLEKPSPLAHPVARMDRRGYAETTLLFWIGFGCGLQAVKLYNIDGGAKAGSRPDCIVYRPFGRSSITWK